jgi:hypothetical protein
VSEFRCEVVRPDPHSEHLTARKTGWLHAFVGDEEAGRLSYGEYLDARVVRTTQFETHDGFRLQGCATELVRALRREYPGFRVITSGYTPTAEGAFLLASLERKGLVEIATSAEELS